MKGNKINEWPLGTYRTVEFERWGKCAGEEKGRVEEELVREWDK